MAERRTFGVLTALPQVELPAVLRAFGLPANSKFDDTIDGERYWYAPLTLSRGDDARVVISCIGLSGNSESTLPVERLINNYSPECVLLVGIGCGVRDFALGDVATSDLMWAYEYLKSTNTGQLDRSRARIAPRHIQDDVQFFTDSPLWHALLDNCVSSIEKTKLPREPVTTPSLHRSVWIASGEKVLANGELDRLRAAHDLIRAGEMEGYGFALACEDRRPLVPWLVIRGISDYGDATKDGGVDAQAPRKDEYHHIAAQSAAAFGRIFLSHAYTVQSREHSRDPHDRGAIVVAREGFRSVFSSDHDPDFMAALLSLVRSARREIIISGIGLSFLKGNTELIGAIVKAVTGTPDLRVEIYYANPQNRGVKSRVEEEAAESLRVSRAYNKQWPKQHLESIVKALRARMPQGDLGRLTVSLTDCLPMITVIRIDDAYLWYPYGTPNIRGKESPWILMDRGSTNAVLRPFLDGIIEYYQRTRKPLSLTDDPKGTTET